MKLSSPKTVKEALVEVQEEGIFRHSVCIPTMSSVRWTKMERPGTGVKLDVSLARKG